MTPFSLRPSQSKPTYPMTPGEGTADRSGSPSPNYMDLEQGLYDQPAQIHTGHSFVSRIVLAFHHIFHSSNRPWYSRIASFLRLRNFNDTPEAEAEPALPQANDHEVGIEELALRPTGGALTATKEAEFVFGVYPTIGIGGIVTSPRPESAHCMYPASGARGVVRWNESKGPVNVDGGYGDIFLGHLHDGTKVAVKRLRRHQSSTESQLGKICQSEHRIWHQLHHPHILPLLGHFSLGPYHYLVSPYMVNGTLFSFIRKPGFTLVAGLRVLVDLASAITHLHANDIVHGDIKSQNVLLSPNHRGILCDFGLSKELQACTITPLKGVGSTRWQSPELMDRGSRKTKESDVYAFGMTIIEVVTRDVPFPDIETQGQMAKAVLVERRRPVFPNEADELARSLWNLAEACWADIPEKRIPISKALAECQDLLSKFDKPQ